MRRGRLVVRYRALPISFVPRGFNKHAGPDPKRLHQRRSRTTRVPAQRCARLPRATQCPQPSVSVRQPHPTPHYVIDSMCMHVGICVQRSPPPRTAPHVCSAAALPPQVSSSSHTGMLASPERRLSRTYGVACFLTPILAPPPSCLTLARVNKPTRAPFMSARPP